jgi:hypothetical protein
MWTDVPHDRTIKRLAACFAAVSSITVIRSGVAQTGITTQGWRDWYMTGPNAQRSTRCI